MSSSIAGLRRKTWGGRKARRRWRARGGEAGGDGAAGPGGGGRPVGRVWVRATTTMVVGGGGVGGRLPQAG